MIAQMAFGAATQDILRAQNDEIKRLRESLAPFAAIGGLLIRAGKDAIPDGASANRLKLDGLYAHHFRDAAAAFQR